MNLETLLLSLPTVVAIAGVNIYPMVLPDQCPYPALTYQVIARVNNPTMQTLGSTKLRIQLESFAKEYVTADNLRNAVISALSGYFGTVGTATVNYTQAISAYDYFEDEIELYRLVAEFYLWTN